MNAFWEGFEKRAGSQGSILALGALKGMEQAQAVAALSAATATGIYGLSKFLGMSKAHRESKYYKKQTQLANEQLKLLKKNNL